MTLHQQRGLYAITTQTNDTEALLDWARAVIDGGAVWLQYRDKSGDHGRRQEQAQSLKQLCRLRGVRFLVNDDIDLALACAADGVHLGEHDTDLTEARARLGDQGCIGVSCYDDVQRARRLARDGADYLAFGAFYTSTNKPQARRAEASALIRARSLGLPLVAIGGITPDNGGPLIDAGADLLAVIGGLAGSPKTARAAALRYSALFDDQIRP